MSKPKVGEETVEAEVDKDAELKCPCIRLQSESQPIWEKRDQNGTYNRINNDSRFEISKDNKGSVMKIRKITSKDSGKYQCIFYEDGEKTIHKITLKVVIFKSVEAKLGNDVELKCDCGPPSSNPIWKKQAEDETYDSISDDLRFQITTNYEGCMMKILKFSLEDVGTYRCEVQHKDGKIIIYETLLKETELYDRS
ncbi:titin-like [Anneissia japonica]|uniref:titin-like n=1 Tax=Anneissia japonica TaxID=1529436 RepID=UPI0014256018|nr:titin-like [Anneissia japonica]